MRLVSGAAAGALVMVSVVSMSAPVTAAGPNVQVDSDSASIHTSQALNSTDPPQTRSASGNDFVGFAAHRHPADLTGVEGTANAFVSEASTVQTSSTTFPLGPVSSISTSGRTTDSATKTSNPAPGVPVATSDGSFGADFTLSAPTPVQFGGALQAANSDADNCTDITVTLTGGSPSYSFSASAGSNGGCNVANKSRSFAVTDVLSPGSYTLTERYASEVDAENPGTLSASVSVDVHLVFFQACTKVGGPGNDTLLGTSGDDVLCGRGGDDTISGGGGNDLIFGEGGNDSISGGPGADVIHGDAGADTIHAGGGADRVLGGSGPDTLLGEDGDDSLSGGDGSDTVDGGAGADTLHGGAGADNVFGREGRDHIVGGDGRDDLVGGTENDTIRARDGFIDTVSGGAGSHDVAFVDHRDHVTGVESINP